MCVLLAKRSGGFVSLPHSSKGFSARRGLFGLPGEGLSVGESKKHAIPGLGRLFRNISYQAMVVDLRILK